MLIAFYSYFVYTGNGYIDFSEFLAMMVLKLKEGPTEKEMRGSFQAFDKDGNGLIRYEMLTL